MDAGTAPAPPACIVRGHDHRLAQVGRHVQDGTGAVAHTWECPTGDYRWFTLAGRPLDNATRMKRPRWGWRK